MFCLVACGLLCSPLTVVEHEHESFPYDPPSLPPMYAQSIMNKWHHCLYCNELNQHSFARALRSQAAGHQPQRGADVPQRRLPSEAGRAPEVAVLVGVGPPEAHPAQATETRGERLTHVVRSMRLLPKGHQWL